MQSKRREKRNASSLALELRRQLVHAIAGMATVIIILLFDRPLSQLALGLAVFATMLLVLYRRHRTEFHKHFGLEALYRMETWIETRIMDFERPGEAMLRGPLLFFTGSLIVYEFFPLYTAIAAILVLAISDSASTLVGRIWGTHRLPMNKQKTWEGSTTFFVGALAVLVFFTSPARAVSIALAAAIVEMAPRMDDNITVPIAVALMLIL